ncbi:hypothetical protein CR513_29698, partial [Mucuna pruriens]
WRKEEELTIFHGERHEGDVRIEKNRREERRERHGRRGEEPREEELHMFECKISQFLGDCKSNEYIDWELMVDQIVSSFDLHGHKVVRLVTLKFCGYALVWWSQVLEEIRIDKRGPYEGWRDLKRLMRETFVPSSYIWDLHVKLQRLHQGPYSVEEYHKEMKMDLLRAQIKESEEATVTQFLHGLKREIQDVVELQHCRSLSELVHQAINAEMQLRRSVYRKTYKGSSGWKGKRREKDKASMERSPQKGSEASIDRKELTPISNSIKCLKCLGKGHITSQYPNRSVMIVKDDREIRSESSIGEVSTSSKFESLSDGSHYERDLLVVRRLMNSHVEEETETQGENIFHSWEPMLYDYRWGKLYHVASERLVKKLALPTIVHLRPELLVDRQVEVMFTLGEYEDRVVCDVVPIEATHLLLGRPWQFDKKVIYDGVTNRFTFIHIGQRVVLKALSPSKVQEDQKKMNVKMESERKTKSKMRKKVSKSDAEKRKVRGKEKMGEKSKSDREKKREKRKDG